MVGVTFVTPKTSSCLEGALEASPQSDRNIAYQNFKNTYTLVKIDTDQGNYSNTNTSNNYIYIIDLLHYS